MKDKYNRVANSSNAIESIKNKIDEFFSRTIENNSELFHVFICPYQPEKTYLQLKAIRELCNQLSEKVDGEYGHYTSEQWYRFYKLRAYVPLLKQEALAKRDQSTLDLIEKASQLIKASKEQVLFSTGPMELLEAYNNYLTELANTGHYSAMGLISEGKRTFNASQASDEHTKINNNYTISDFISDNSAFSYANASKENLIKVIDYMIKHAKANDIELILDKKKG